MATNIQSLFDYLAVKGLFGMLDRERLKEIHTRYDRLKNEQFDSNAISVDELIKKLTQQFPIDDDKENIDRLKRCVTQQSFELAYQNLQKEYINKLSEEKKKAKQIATSTNITETSIVPNPTTQTNVETISTIICQILIKQNQGNVIGFIQHFLLCPFNEIQHKQKLIQTANPLSPDVLYSGRVISGSILDAFIRSQLLSRGHVVDTGRSLTKFCLVEPLVLSDEFDTWYFDYLRDLFELNLLSPEKSFPKRWKIDENTKIFYLLELPKNNDNIDQGTRNVDRPSTVSLQRFIEDVCEKENNGMTKKWFEALHEDDIFTYDHLANLKFDEWNQLKKISMNGRKILKSYIDREKQMTNDIENLSKVDQSNSNTHSQSELCAKIHQVRLYFHYKLAEKFHAAKIPNPAKLDADCVRLSFDEMRKEGFEDDGLFDQMKLFFLPLTMIEKDLATGEKRISLLSRQRIRQIVDLTERKESLTVELSKKENDYYEHNNAIDTLRREIQRVQRQISNHFEQQGYDNFTIHELLNMHTKEMECLKTENHDLRTEIQDIDDRLNSLERVSREYNVNQTNKCDRDLVKPNRGFIMYGPPGTGKSDIMSKLSTRMGVCMVAPPLAAGELNRPLVGESERIIVDICMRCHRIPYLMCCVAIDEIDSLAPKRKDDSGDGNLAKLSVLLSVIDGIKDVPNLMIFCATNRLHMMDEAFLRRMSGKFFVGRPSSHARKNILSGIKNWHMSPNFLDSLTMATTNFSGAALRALRRLITVYCVDAIREKPYYQLDYRTILQLTDITARQYRIFFGAETLPTIIERGIKGDDATNNNQQFNDLTSENNSIYTGKVLANLNAGVIDVEAIQTHPITRERTKIVCRYPLLDSETNLQGLLQRLTIYGKLRNVQLLQLVDLNLLSAESAHDEKQKFETLKERLDECGAYRRSMIVYDLDSLVGINRSEGNASTGRTTNFSLINHNIYTHIKDKFQNTHVQLSTDNSNHNNETNAEEKWSIVIIYDPFLFRQFSDDVKFTRLQSEIDEEQAEMRRADELLLCVQCNDYYVEQDNRMGACAHHNGFIYDNLSSTLDMYNRPCAIENLSNEEAQITSQVIRGSVTQEQKETYERRKNRFRYICCDQTLQVGGMINGCKRGKHSQPHITRDEWQSICNKNQEYRQKRLTLLQSRAQY
ncbi:unnamed protein product [Adineta steineri]|uniref:AAA+ ATPase domain-containing protein n=1 Tax=Adineta steineri TaxID=433720 RepID=A0A819M7H8_9BILA|nr:unnamed protein product [Adineta steineri]CAF3975134.1 unnamed protein product [Adineta steineri]